MDGEWERSDFCESGACVEVRVNRTDETVAVRDGKIPGGPVLVFTFPEWEAFRNGILTDQFRTSPA